MNGSFQKGFDGLHYVHFRKDLTDCIMFKRIDWLHYVQKDWLIALCSGEVFQGCVRLCSFRLAKGGFVLGILNGLWGNLSTKCGNNTNTNTGTSTNTNTNTRGGNVRGYKCFSSHLLGQCIRLQCKCDAIDTLEKSQEAISSLVGSHCFGHNLKLKTVMAVAKRKQEKMWGCLPWQWEAWNLK